MRRTSLSTATRSLRASEPLRRSRALHAAAPAAAIYGNIRNIRNIDDLDLTSESSSSPPPCSPAATPALPTTGRRHLAFCESGGVCNCSFPRKT